MFKIYLRIQVLRMTVNMGAVWPTTTKSGTGINLSAMYAEMVIMAFATQKINAQTVKLLGPLNDLFSLAT